MASLKEVKLRINSVSSTRKITSAMKLVASSKLHKAQSAIENMRPYQQKMDGIMLRFVAELKEELDSGLAEKREVKKTVVVCISSNSSLCGAFNSNVVKSTLQTIEALKRDNIEVETIPIGVKIAEKVGRIGMRFNTNNSALLDRASYTDTASLAQSLISRYESKEIDRVILIYNHFKNTATQIVLKEDFLPVSFSDEGMNAASQNNQSLDYIVEPSKEQIVESLIPKVLCLKLYTAILDSLAAEHSARVVAMQTATDNADQLLYELTLMYNKTRQAAITSELLDIVGASFQ